MHPVRSLEAAPVQCVLAVSQWPGVVHDLLVARKDRITMAMTNLQLQNELEDFGDTSAGQDV